MEKDRVYLNYLEISRANLEEAGFQEDILLLSPVSDMSILQAMLERKIILTITNLRMAKFIDSLHEEGSFIRVHIAVDTGMGRFGVRWTDIEQLKAIYELSGCSFEGIFSHFSCSFEKTYNKTKMQLERFWKVTVCIISCNDMYKNPM